MIEVLDHGFVELEQHQGGDLSVVNAARVSFNKRVEEIGDADIGIINSLLKGRHGTPFEHNIFTFVIKCPIFVAREWMRHRIGSFNEWSARYSQLEPDFYIPAAKDVRTQVGKAMQYTYRQADDHISDAYRYYLEKKSKSAYDMYLEAIGNGVAKEQARLFLPVNIYTSFWWTVNARSLMNFLSLRTAPTAQFEIREYAHAIETFFAAEMHHTHTAWLRNDKVAP